MADRGRTLGRALGALALAATLVALAPGTALAHPGALDRSFGDNGRVVTKTALDGYGWLDSHVHIAEGPDGTIVAAVGKTVFRYLPDGRLDPSFGEGGKLTADDPEGLPFRLHDLAVDSEGRVYLIGDVEVPDVEVLISYISSTHPTLGAVLRYSPSGQLDTGFGKNGALITDFGQPHYGPVYDKAFTGASRGVVEPDGSLLVVGTVGEIVAGEIRSHFEEFNRLLVRLAPDGGFDSSFGEGGVLSSTGIRSITDLELEAGGALVAVGRSLGTGNGPPTEAVARLRTNGVTDTRFGRNGVRALAATPPGTLAVDGRGRIAVLSGRGVMRLTRDGALDRHFGFRGGTTLKLPGESVISSIAAERSGRMLLAGTQVIGRPGAAPGGPGHRRSFTVIRLSQSGRRDSLFAHRGWLVTRFGKRSAVLGQDAFIDAEGRLVVAGPIARPDLAPTGGIALARYRLGR